MGDYVITRELQKHVDAIKKLDATAKKAVFEIAKHLATVADDQEGLLDDTGYNSVVEFAADQFGYAKSTTLNYVKIANRYLTDSGNCKNVRTLCARLDNGAVTEDYKVGQLNALPGKVDTDEFIRLDKSGVINPDMSADKIKAALKEYYKEPEQDSEPDPEPDPEPEDTGDDITAICNVFNAIAESIVDDETTFRQYCDGGAASIVRGIINTLIGNGYSILCDRDDKDIIIGVTLIKYGNTDFKLHYPEII